MLKVCRQTTFTIILMLSPFLSLYATNINSVSWFDLTVLILGFWYFITSKKLILDKEIFYFILMIIVQFLIVNLSKDIDIPNTTFRMLRYIYYLCILAFFSIKYFNTILGEYYYKKIAIFSSIFLWIQLLVLKIADVYIPGFLTNLPLMRIEMLWHAINYQDRFTLGPRPRSFFSEPQIFATFVAGYIAILLAKEKLDNSEKFVLAFLNLSVVISLSSTGIIALLAIWCGYFVREFRHGRRRKVLMVIILLLVVIGGWLPLLYSSRLIFTGNAINGRLGGYGFLFSQEEELFHVVLGHGMVDLSGIEVGFLPTILRIYYYFGIVGILFMIYMFVKLYEFTSERYKLLTLLDVVLLFGTVDFLGIMIFVSVPYIIAKKYKSRTDY